MNKLFSIIGVLLLFTGLLVIAGHIAIILIYQNNFVSLGLVGCEISIIGIALILQTQKH